MTTCLSFGLPSLMVTLRFSPSRICRALHGQRLKTKAAADTGKVQECTGKTMLKRGMASRTPCAIKGNGETNLNAGDNFRGSRKVASETLACAIIRKGDCDFSLKLGRLLL